MKFTNLKAIGQLSGKTDAALLTSRFDMAAETRPDVAEVCHAAGQEEGMTWNTRRDSH